MAHSGLFHAGLAARPLLGVKQTSAGHRHVSGTFVRLARSPILSIALSQPCSASFIAKPEAVGPRAALPTLITGLDHRNRPGLSRCDGEALAGLYGRTGTLGARFDEMILKAVA